MSYYYFTIRNDQSVVLNKDRLYAKSFNTHATCLKFNNTQFQNHVKVHPHIIGFLKITYHSLLTLITLSLENIAIVFFTFSCNKGVNFNGLWARRYPMLFAKTEAKQ